MGFAFCVTKISSISSSLLGFVLMMEFWTTLSAQLYSWMLVSAVGRLVIFLNTWQFILNFWNCCWVISELSWRSFAVDGFTWIDGYTEGFLVNLSMVSTSPIVLMPSCITTWVTSWSEMQNWGRRDFMAITRMCLSPFSGEWLVAGPRNGYISVYVCVCVCIYIYIYIYWLASVMSRDLYWVTACFIFVCQLDASWGCWASKCCYYCCLFCMLEQWQLNLSWWKLTCAPFFYCSLYWENILFKSWDI